jgi:hypothetical protein
VNHSKKPADSIPVPKSNKGLLALATVLLLIPVVALLWVGSYAKAEPRVAGFPFFIWYQFLWVFLCAACTWGAHRVVYLARPRRSRADRKEHTGGAL